MSQTKYIFFMKNKKDWWREYRCFDVNNNASFLFGGANCKRRQSQTLIEKDDQAAPYFISFQTSWTNTKKIREKNNAGDMLLCFDYADHSIHLDDWKIVSTCALFLHDASGHQVEPSGVAFLHLDFSLDYCPIVSIILHLESLNIVVLQESWWRQFLK